MSLRTAGSKGPWKLEEIKAGFEHFFKEHGRYPTSPEVTLYPYLPAAKTIERTYGGLVALRSQLGLGNNHDYRTGDHSSARARTINLRAHESEQEVYNFLVRIFGKEFVHREYFFSEDKDKRTRADFFVYDKDGSFCVDTFYPSDLRNLTGCINSKLSKYNQITEYPTIFLQMNKNIEQKRVDALVENKKRKLGNRQSLMCWDTFAEFCNRRIPLKVGRAA